LVRVLREGAIDRAALREVIGDLLEPDPDSPVADIVTPASDSTSEAAPDSDIAPIASGAPPQTPGSLARGPGGGA
ncbi:MAG: hypothetical protein ACXWZG_03495, partial [Microbacterium sp.]